MTKLIQKSLPFRKEFSILEDGILVREKNIAEDAEYKVKFEELGFDLHKRKNNLAAIIYFTLIFYNCVFLVEFMYFLSQNENTFKDLTAMVITSFILFSSTIVAYWKMMNHTIRIEGGERVIELFESIPSRDLADSFIQNIQSSRNYYLKKKFTNFKTNQTFTEKLNHLLYLKGESIISEIEFSELLKKISNQTVIGFQKPEINE